MKLKLKQSEIWEIEDYCAENYCPVSTFLENLETLTGKNSVIIKVEDEEIFTEDGEVFAFSDVI